MKRIGCIIIFLVFAGTSGFSQDQKIYVPASEIIKQIVTNDLNPFTWKDWKVTFFVAGSSQKNGVSIHKYRADAVNGASTIHYYVEETYGIDDTDNAGVRGITVRVPEHQPDK